MLNLKSIPSILAKNKSKIAIYIALLLIIIAGAVLRLHRLSTQSYWMDEGYTINAVLSISEKGSMILDSGENYSCATYCYPTAYITKIFGNNAFSYRLFSAIIGIIFILIIFIIINNLFNSHIALLSSFLVSFSYWQIAWSRQARWYTLFALLFWLALYFFYKSLYANKNKFLNIVLTATFTILAIFTHGLGYLLPLIFIGWIIINQVFIQKKFNWKKNIVIILNGIIILWLFNLISGIDILSYLFNNLNLHYVLPYYLSFYLRTYWPFIALALVALFNKNGSYKKEIYFLLFTLGAYLIPLSFFTDMVQYRYMFHLTPIFFILGSIGLLSLHEDIKPLYGKIILWIAALGVFITMAGGMFVPQTNYYLESDDPETLGSRPHYAYTPQPQWNNAYEFIKINKIDSDIIISSMPQFNKIFLGEAGYWIKYNYLGLTDKQSRTSNNKEFYVGAETLNNLEEVKSITSSNHGFIIFDYMAIDEKIAPEIIKYITNTFTQVFYEKTNSYSQVWVYKF